MVQRLVDLAKNTAARRLLESFEFLPFANLVSEVNETAAAFEVEHGQVVQFFRQLDSAGCGRFIVGRRGYSSRFAWKFDPASVGDAALQRRHDLDSLETEDANAGAQESDERTTAQAAAHNEEEAGVSFAGDDESMSYNFPLRRGVWVTFTLPISLTKIEAERLATFIQALPVK